MTLTYGSVCSGVEAASVAWEPLGMRPLWFSEIDPFCNAVLAHRWPDVPNLGDITREDFVERARRQGGVDVLVGGTPCQSFSVSGRKGGLSDPRGELSVVFLRTAAAVGATWVVWENVPGVLRAGGGRDFGVFLGTLAQFGFGFAYRVLDAQFFGVPQRRRRVFVVGRAGDWDGPRRVLFEPEAGRRLSETVCEVGEEAARPAATDTRDEVYCFYAHSGLDQAVQRGLTPPLTVGTGLAGIANPPAVCYAAGGAGVLRRLTPLECERVQGLPDRHTLVPWEGGPPPDRLRYKAIGNSMAVPVMKWIGERLLREGGQTA